MKKSLLLLWIPVFVACDQFQTKKVSSEEILSEETKDLNWHEVDQYPTFRECEDILDVEEAKSCFGNKVAEYVYSRLEQKKPVVTRPLHDTLGLHLVVSAEGIPSIDSVEIDSLVVQHLPKIRTWIQESVDSLPKIEPAIKRGIPVSTKFKMSIVLQSD